MVPVPGRFDDGRDVGVLRSPLEGSLGERCVGNKRGGIAGARLSNPFRDRMPGNLAARIDHLAYTVAVTGAEIEL